jgi:poly(A) polymerase
MPALQPPQDLSGLSLGEIARLAEAKKLPPVESWNPRHCGSSGMRIARDGTWFHEDSPISRPAMVRLFSTILRREADGGFVLVTPVEKLDIEVEDAPFTAVELKTEGEGKSRLLAFRLNTGDLIIASAKNPLRFTHEVGGPHPYPPHPYLKVREGLDALISRSVYYELANLALAEGANPPGLWSDGAFFHWISTDEPETGAALMKLPHDQWQKRDGMSDLLIALGAEKGDTRYVGGCVRDTLLGLPVSDIDLATRLAPEEVLKRLEDARIKAVPTGLAHGTITAVLPDGPVEVTTLRCDVSTDGRRATIAYTGDWQEDAARRDFTINALSADPASGEIFDYFNGLEDLKQHRVRFIGDPLTRIAEDHLRILRFFRFHARFGNKDIDSEALAACAARANDLMALSRERIGDEILKILMLAKPAPTLGLMVQQNILRPVLPEIDAAGVARLTKLEAKEAMLGITPDAIRRLAALLPPDPDIAASVAARLRFSNKATKRLVSAVSYAIKEQSDPYVLAYWIGKKEAVDRLLLTGDERAVDLLNWEKPRLGLKGGDLITMGLKPGPAVTKTLKSIEHEWASGGFTDNKEKQREVARRHVDQALGDIP